MVVLHGNGEDIYFLISATLPTSPSPHLPISPSPHLPTLPVLRLPLLCTTTQIISYEAEITVNSRFQVAKISPLTPAGVYPRVGGDKLLTSEFTETV